MRNMGIRGRSGQHAWVAAAICLAGGLVLKPQPVLGGPCYSLYQDVYCTQCPAASCDPACDAYGTYNPCECDPFPCDPPACTCSPPEDDGVAVCIDPPETWIGLHAKYIVAFGSEFEWESPDPLFAGFLANDQPETCFDKACDDLSRNAITQCIDSEELTRTLRSFVPVPGGQVEFNVYAIEVYPFEPETYFTTGVLTDIRFCTGGTLYSGWGTGGTFYAHPLLYANPAPPGDAPLYIGLGTSIQLTPHAYCNEAYVYVGGRFVLGSRCPPNLQIWNPINSGDPLSDALDADCQIWATAVAPGSAEITLTGEDTWGRQRDLPEPLEYQIVEMDIDLAGLADELEMTLPGKGIGLNSDDDDDDSVVDLVDSYVAGEDELVSMQVTARGADCPYRYRFCFGANVRIWRDSSKGGPPLVSGELLAPGDHPSSLHVEAVASGNGAITGELWIDPDQDGSW